MHYLVVSDIHANLEALEAVLADPSARRCDRVLVLGDLVGYGADPNAVIDRIRTMPSATIIRGNHDKVGSGLDRVDGFNFLARHAIEWTGTVLTADNRAWLRALSKGPVAIDALVEICHGTPFDEDLYVFDDLDALRALRTASRPLCLFGHTHVPAAFRLDGTLAPVGPLRGSRVTLPLDADARYLVNCGSVGQPRDGDSSAAFGIVDTEMRTLQLRRVPYNVAAAQAKIIAAGLPDVLAQRLAMGR